MEKKKSKRNRIQLWQILFTAVMTVVLMLGGGIKPSEVFAIDATSLIIKDEIGGTSITVDTKENANGNGWSWDTTSKQLTLENFKGEYIEATGGKLTIKLKGTNILTLADGSGSIGIKQNTSSEPIVIDKTDSDTEDKLIIRAGRGFNYGTAITAYGVSLNGGTLDIEIEASPSGGMVYGITTNGQIQVNNSANLITNISASSVYAINGLYGNGTGSIDINVKAAGEAVAIGSLYMTGSNAVTISAETTSTSKKAYAIQYIKKMAEQTNVTVNKGVVMSYYLNQEITHDISDQVKITPKDSAKDWIIISKEGYGTNKGIIFADATTKEPITDGMTFIGQTEPVELGFKEIDLFDIEAGKVGDTPKNSVNVLGYIDLKEGLRGVNPSKAATGYTYKVVSGELPQGLIVNAGKITGTFAKECEAGNVEIKITRNIDNASKIFTINYGAISAEEKYLTIGNTKYNMASDASGAGWNYTASDTTLNLKNYNAGEIEAEKDLNIVLTGQNTITMAAGKESYGIKLPATKKLTIDKASSDTTDKLNIEGTGSALGGCGITCETLNVNGGVLDVNIDVNVADYEIYGINAADSIYVEQAASLTVKVHAETGGKQLYGISNLVSSGSGTININVYGPKEVAAVNTVRQTGNSAIIVNAQTSAADSKAYAIKGLKQLGADTNLTVSKGIVMSADNYVYYMRQPDISDQVQISITSDVTPLREWILLPKKGYGNNGMVYVDVQTGEPITDGMTFKGQASPVNFTFTDSEFFDLKMGKVGEGVTNKESVAYRILLCGGLKGVNIKNTDTYTFSIINGTLPSGLSITTTGEISGTYDTPCEAGSVDMEVTRKSDNAKATFTLNYGGVTVQKPVTKVELDQKELILNVSDTKMLKETISPSDASDKTVSWQTSEMYVASVRIDGTVSGNNPGKAIITVTTRQGRLTDTCDVYVKEKKPTSVFSGGKIKGVSANGAYTISCGSDSVIKTADSSGMIEIEENWIGKTVYVVKNNPESKCNSDPQELFITMRNTITVTDGRVDSSVGEITDAFSGVDIKIVANEAPRGKEFDKWEIVSGNITLSNPKSATSTFIMPNEAVSVKAVYKNIETGNGENPEPGTGENPNPGSGDPQNPGSGDPQNPGSGDPQNPGSGDPQNPGSGDSQNPGIGENPNPGNDNTPDTATINQGQTYTVKSYKYKVTNADTTGKGTVTITKSTKSKSKVTSISIPSTVKINGETFKVTQIADNAFKNCNKLKKVTIGSNVTKIGKNAFYGCKSLKTITVKSKKVKTVGKNAFKGINKKCKIKVPKTKLKAYKKTFAKKGQAKTVKISK